MRLDAAITRRGDRIELVDGPLAEGFHSEILPHRNLKVISGEGPDYRYIWIHGSVRLRRPQSKLPVRGILDSWAR